MRNFRKLDALWLFGLAFLLIFAVALGLSARAQAAVPQPVAGPTPISEPRGAINASVVELAAARVITGDVRLGCIDSVAANKLDVLYGLTVGTVNTATITLQHTNLNPSVAGALFADGPDVATNVVTTTTGMQQVQAFGAWTCVFADVTNTNTLTITVNALVK